MADRRRTPANDRIAAAHLTHAPEGLERVDGIAARIGVPVADLLRTPDGARDRQLVYGEPVTVYEDCGGWAFLQAAKDSYVGYVPSSALTTPFEATHWVSAPATHAYSADDFKSPETSALSHGSRVEVMGGTGQFTGRFVETSLGFIPARHLSPLGAHADDPVMVAELFLGTPYLWGGNSRFGIDCSGLVQAALLACGTPCPGDSDMQEEELGEPVPDADYSRGDLLFWKGHVALVRDAETLIHANAHDMAVAIEPIGAAIKRIQAQGDGPLTSHKRLA
ncbi:MULTISPECIES: C40 family peptidase [unclassified Leisingera]|uniref:C40 family peptidase n=1 Tax=unclassified Leisingera TaxID=2614906 RepID=UPI0002D2E158|nr:MULTISPECIES: NlpC/P60 family protein [unclassified Leisingera]KIC22734.1 NLP/P60 hydrolase [Leisingera sp. ANG-S3]KIC51622.1 NLP/P60 hydrolase [Leisingera sp. ANG-S]KID08808.1 NLP/P60 hydrolase [Leisingera sp. ANG1]